MSMIDRSIDSLTFLTEEFREVLRRRLRELGGAALIGFAGLLTLALGTWSVKDPSFSHATNTKVGNLLGFPGAAIADLLMQLFGLAVVALVLSIAIWGWRLTAHHAFDRKWLRALSWIGGFLLACAFASCLPNSPSWPLPTGLGGVIGDGILRLPALVFGVPLKGWGTVGFAILSGGLGLVLLAFAVGFGKTRDPIEEMAGYADELSEDDHAAISLGRIVHWLLMLKSQISRLIAGRLAARAQRAQAQPVAARNLHDVRFDDRARTPLTPALAPADAIEDDEEEYEDEEDDAPPPARKRARAAPPKPSRKGGGGFVLPPHNLLADHV